ncbi:hypothetical protein GCM10010515_35340 [Streptomyces fructofermentans]|uniref:Uncharacterized protein n=1 Tax=Streptomyces fructofermentans TaxID=152141 RepID=A0A918NG52_9ACTN|nr:hypothetical protein GCM10010515_35340 [Streptomyces fructofermentans]
MRPRPGTGLPADPPAGLPAHRAPVPAEVRGPRTGSGPADGLGALAGSGGRRTRCAGGARGPAQAYCPSPEGPYVTCHQAVPVRDRGVTGDH